MIFRRIRDVFYSMKSTKINQMNEILQVIKSFNANGQTIEEKHNKMSQVARQKITRTVNR